MIEKVEEMGGSVNALEFIQREIEESARLVMISAPIEPRTMRILPRGNWLDDSGPEVWRAVRAIPQRAD